MSFRTAIGGIVQYGYSLPAGRNGALDFGLRATLIHYSTSGLSSLDGSGVGFFFRCWF